MADINEPDFGMSGAYAELSEGALQPMFDASDGVRAELERRGWSPTAAETAALENLLGMTRHFWHCAIAEYDKQARASDA